ncbi:hypothetical protein A0J48_021880 [Sphaerospermopsis aphanizomenoides BCCUSP55]|uniref:hypothetical protein n=1 Tax=Sphaerospermopsis aphanizomenoides TaxID=459663 RepID=UPI00190345B9|nr:hypothetical protein [Sphaerospermopsis aphanizomenoides]MBK1990142.1 hypothetical protein [Sphaerospermopsis aphanizomenoides BCCUSP55]
MDILNWILGLFGGITPVVGIVLLIFFLRQKKGQDLDIPPLDLIDAKKLDDMVSKQVEDVLKPLLENKGYTEEQVKQILTRTSLGNKTFRR